MKHTGQPIEVIGMIPFSLETEEEAVVILQNLPCISNVDEYYFDTIFKAICFLRRTTAQPKS